MILSDVMIVGVLYGEDDDDDSVGYCLWLWWGGGLG